MDMNMWMWIYECKYANVNMWMVICEYFYVDMWIWGCQDVNVDMWIYKCVFFNRICDCQYANENMLMWIYYCVYVNICKWIWIFECDFSVKNLGHSHGRQIENENILFEL